MEVVKMHRIMQMINVKKTLGRMTEKSVWEKCKLKCDCYKKRDLFNIVSEGKDRWKNVIKQKKEQ